MAEASPDDRPIHLPAGVPERRALDGEHVRLEPLDAARHAAGLLDAAQGEGADPELWTYLPNGPYEDLAAYEAWAREAAVSDDPLFLAIVATTDSAPCGVAAFLRMEPKHGSIEIGHIWFGHRLQRSAGATEAIFLLMRHAFDALGHRRLEWKCNAENARSRRAAERFGFTYEGTFRQHMVVKGANRDTAWYSMLDHEWPAIRAGFEAWLAPENFDAGGHQRAPLAVRSAGS